MRQADDRQGTGGVAAPGLLPEGRFWRFELRRPGDTAGTEPRLEALRVAARTRFRLDDWMDEADVERALTELLTGHAGEPVTVGDHATVDGTECGYLLRVFFQTRPLRWEVELVDVTYTDAEGQAVMMPWLEEEQGPFAQF
jgi:hypothetical protein